VLAGFLPPPPAGAVKPEESPCRFLVDGVLGTKLGTDGGVDGEFDGSEDGSIRGGRRSVWVSVRA
jgi:hypothetical protein